MKKLFFNQQQLLLFYVLCSTTLFDFGLLALRFWLIDYDFSQVTDFWDLFYHHRSMTFLFLVFNLFLAWMPYWISMSFKTLDEKCKTPILLSLVAGLWLLFFPNAPYIITDLIHIKSRPPVPVWYDALLIFSFAWTGLMLGFASLLAFQTLLQKYFSKWTVGSIILTVLSLAGLGVYIGRFQRWHSWHILTSPEALIMDIGHRLLHPLSYANTLGLAVVLTGFLILGYITVLIVIHPNIQSKKS